MPDPPGGYEWCRAYHSWPADPRGASVIECKPATQDLDTLTKSLARLASQATGRPLPASYSRETIAGRYTVHKYWSGSQAQPSLEARIVEGPGGVLWAGAVVPGANLSLTLGPAPDPSRRTLPPPPATLDPPPAPRGQKVIRKPPIYAAEGVPEVPSRPVLEVGFYGPEGPDPHATVQAELLAGMEEEMDFHCVTGWSVRGVRWSGVPLPRLFEEAGVPLEPGGWVLALSWGGYATLFPSGLAGRVWLVTGIGGSPLSLERGWPARLTSQVLFGWKHAKWLRGLYVGRGYLDGFWEARGYHERGLVVVDERFKVLDG